MTDPSAGGLTQPRWDLDLSARVLLHHGIGVVAIDGDEQEVPVRVWFSWDNGVRVRAHGTGVLAYALSDLNAHATVTLGDLPPFSVSVLDSTVESSEQAWSLEGRAEDDAVASDVAIARVDFQVANFARTWGVRPLTLKDEAYVIDLAPHPDARERIKGLKLTRRGATTYLGRLSRADGETMAWNDVSDVLYALQLLLSFATGDWAPVLLPTGADDAGNLVAVGLRLPHRESYQGRLTWCTDFHLEALPQLWIEFQRLWSRRETRQLLQLTLSLYLEAQHGDLLETRLVHAVTLLEALAWDELVRVGEMDAGRVDTQKASWRIRKLISRMGVDPSYPSGLDHIRRWDRGGDGPRAITRLRNEVVHPTSMGEIFSVSSDIKLEVLNLAMWYADLALLHLLQHDGYHLRRAQEPPIWAGRGELVPWATRGDDHEEAGPARTHPRR